MSMTTLTPAMLLTPRRRRRNPATSRRKLWAMTGPARSALSGSAGGRYDRADLEAAVRAAKRESPGAPGGEAR